MYITFKQFSEKHEWPSLSALRSLYFEAVRNKNSFLPSFRKVGRRILVDPDKFFEIVRENFKVKQVQLEKTTPFKGCCKQ